MTTPVVTVPVIEGLGLHLSAKGLVQYGSSVYTENPTRPAYVAGALPGAPDTAVAMNVYNIDRSRDSFNPDFYIQLRFRAAGRDLRTVYRLADNVFAELHWADDHLHEVWPNGVRVLHSQFLSRTDVAPDGNGRYEVADSYRITFNPGAAS